MEHSPIPKQLYYRVDTPPATFATPSTGGGSAFHPLPSHLDRLFRASPKLADAFQRILDLPSLSIPVGIRDPHYFTALRKRVAEINGIARAALAALAELD